MRKYIYILLALLVVGLLAPHSAQARMWWQCNGQAGTDTDPNGCWGIWVENKFGTGEPGFSMSDAGPSIVAKPIVNGKVWRYTFPNGLLNYQGDVANIWTPMPRDLINDVPVNFDPPRTEFWIQYYFMYSSGFDWHDIGDKQYYFNTIPGSNAIGAILKSGGGSPMMQAGCQESTWCGDVSAQGDINGKYTTNITNTRSGIYGWYGFPQEGVWHKIKQHWKLNDSGVKNGVFEQWIDDIKTSYHTGWAWEPGYVYLKPSSIGFVVIHGGIDYDPPSVVGTHYLYIDDIWIGDTDPGGTTTTGDTQAPYPTAYNPARNSVGIGTTNRTISFELRDDRPYDTGVDTSTVVVSVEGTDYTCASSELSCTGGDPSVESITYTNSADWTAGQVIDITIDADDVAGNSMGTDTYTLSVASSSGGSGWVEVWSAEFNDPACTSGSPCLPENESLDGDLWDYLTSDRPWEGPNDPSYKASDIDNSKVADGYLYITAIDEDYGGKSVTSAHLQSKASFQYGRIEVGMKMPSTTNAINCAAWTVGQGPFSWPESGEMDFSEYVPGSGWGVNKVSQGFHSRDFYGGTSVGGYMDVTAQTGTTPYGAFHEYAVEWYPDHIQSYIDDIPHIYRSYTSDYPNAFQYPHKIRLYLSTGDAWGSTVQFPFSPITCIFDYVRVYEGGATLSINTSSLADGEVGTPYSQTIEATGGYSPYTWSIDSGALPGGLDLGASSGAITGVPSAAGTFNFTVKVEDSPGGVSDSFTRGNEFPLSGSGWTSIDYSSGLGYTCRTELIGQQVVSTCDPGGYTTASFWSSQSFGLAQWSQATIVTADPIADEIGGPGVLLSDQSGDWNGCYVNIADNVTAAVWCVDDAVTYTQTKIGADITDTFLQGDIIKLGYDGVDTFTIYKNGSSIATRTDSGGDAPTIGVPGIMVDWDGGGIWDDWAAGEPGSSDTQALSIDVTQDVPAGHTTIYLREDTGLLDTWIDSANPLANYESSSTMYVIQFPDYTIQAKALMRIDISSVPTPTDNAVVTQAILRMHAAGDMFDGVIEDWGSIPMSVYVRRVTFASDPDFSLLNWNNYTGVEGEIEDRTSVGDPTGKTFVPPYTAFNVTNALQDAIEEGQTYLYLVLDGGGDGIAGTKRKFVTTTQPYFIEPSLYVTYKSGYSGPCCPSAPNPGVFRMQKGYFKSVN